MSTHRSLKCLVVAWVCCVTCQTSPAQGPDCRKVTAMARMARAQSTPKLLVQKGKAGVSYRSQLIFADRFFELHPNDLNAAISLLDLIPGDHDQHSVWMTLGDSLCDDESLADIRTLGRVRDDLPHELAKAVLLVPEKLTRYLDYALIAAQDPHSDYAAQMEAVCRAKHAEFQRSVRALPLNKSAWLTKHVLDPENCHAHALPESQ